MAGEETVGGTACHKVVLTHAEGGTMTVFFDKETGLVHQQEIPVPEMGGTVTVRPSDYRKVGDLVLMPHRIDQEGLMNIEIEHTSVRVNVDDIPEDAFELPAAVHELAGQ